MKRVYRYIEMLNELAGNAVSYLFPVLVAIMSFEVVARYLFNRPQIWTWDVAKMFLILIVMWSGGYGVVHKAHVTVDVLMIRLSSKTKRIIGLFTVPLTLFGIGILLWTSAERAWGSLRIHERFGSLWNPPIYPLRIALVLGVFLLFIQVLIQYALFIKGGKD